jgi:hypothetical protein
MLHDNHLHAVTQGAGMHPRRALELQVWAHFIDAALASKTDALPFAQARALLNRMHEADAATVARAGDLTILTLLGITVQTNGGDYALLSNWRAAALNRIREAHA